MDNTQSITTLAEENKRLKATVADMAEALKDVENLLTSNPNPGESIRILACVRTALAKAGVK